MLTGGGPVLPVHAAAAAAQLDEAELESVRRFSSELRGKSLDDLKSSKIIDRYPNMSYMVFVYFGIEIQLIHGLKTI